MNLSQIIKRPLITEQSMQDASKGVFTFEVVSSANKNQISEAIEKFFGVDVLGVRTTKMPASRYKVGRRRQEKVGKSSKKARVQLEAGQKIDLFELEEGN